MVKTQLQNLLACPNCAKTLDIRPDKAFCSRCQKRFPVKNGVYYFEEIRGDILPSHDTRITDSRKWTPWRKKNYFYFQRELPASLKGKYVLDVGAGKGHFKALFETANYVAIDFYDYENVNVIADVTKRFPFKDGVFDYLILSNVIEHIFRPANLFTECHRVLKKTGIVIITVPFFIKIHQEPHDFFRYTPYALEGLLAEAGFSNIAVEGLGDIFDIHQSNREEMLGIAHQNLTRNVKKRYWRIIPRLYLRLVGKLTSFFFQTIKNNPLFRKYQEGKAEKTDHVPGYGIRANK